MTGLKGLGSSLPIYVTRPHGRNGVTASYELSLWMPLLAILVVWANIIAWGFIGLVYAARVIL